ncbi:LVIS_2131 family protein [Apilactobacillus sp. TMW 2.2459]|uniref:LVIS_2131 family protein n=1 Tax=Apilactobacillus xinyiensis TaxID=2841032 RepID=UPI00200F3F5A|nr:LVIS_2131 family protein [Apilactobacillus xinyiensis]MCL0312004.1 LVIS_2131 family protein [Apilactobacillus xinyiensis]
MKSAWNFVGLILWLFLLFDLLIILFYLFITIRDNKKDNQPVFEKCSKYFTHIILNLCFGLGMAYFAFNNKLILNSVITTKAYSPLILDTNGFKSYYIKVNAEKNVNHLNSYSYLSNGKKNVVNSNQAMVLDNNFDNYKSLYKISNKYSNHDLYKSVIIQELDAKTQKAWVVTMQNQYKNNLVNGIGFKAGKLYDQYTVIRVPNSSFIYNENE